jgi:putative ABC transport system permease protein
MNLLVGALSMGLLLSLLALGVFVAFRILGTYDLTADGAFGLGAVVAAALLARGWDPTTASIVAGLAGGAAGALTGVLHTRLKVDILLAGILVTTALYSLDLFLMKGGDIPLSGTKALPGTAERIWVAAGLPEKGLTLFGTQVSARNLATFVALIPAAGVPVFLLDRFFRTSLGLALRATGDNRSMARAVGVDVDAMFVLGLVAANGMVGLSGALFAQYQSFANIQMSFGNLVTGLGCVILGDAISRGRPLGRRIMGVVTGTVLFRLLVAGAITAGVAPNALKLMTALFVLGVLVVPDLVRTQLGPRLARGGARG